MPRIVLQTPPAKATDRLRPARAQGFASDHGHQRGFASATRAFGCQLLGLALLASAQAWAQGVPQRLPTVTLGAGIVNIKAEVAQSPREHEIGLMHRTSMGSNEGMLFIFERAGVQCFWMKNTLIPLSVAFVADDGTVVNVDEMKPETLDSHCSARPVRFVLEMNKGWFKRHGVKAGSKLAGEPFGTPR